MFRDCPDLFNLAAWDCQYTGHLCWANLHIGVERSTAYVSLLWYEHINMLAVVQAHKASQVRFIGQESGLKLMTVHVGGRGWMMSDVLVTETSDTGAPEARDNKLASNGNLNTFTEDVFTKTAAKLLQNGNTLRLNAHKRRRVTHLV